MGDANIFLSYNHADNDHLDDGIIVFMKQVLDEYEFQTGNTLNLFIDRESIEWGSDWRRALARGVEATNFIMPAVTPRYLKSEACRRELLAFQSQVENRDNSMILSLVWQDVSRLAAEMGDDPVYRAVTDNQHIRVDDLRDLAPSDAPYKQLVREVATSLGKLVSKHVETDAGKQLVVSDADSDEQEGLLELFEKASAGIPVFNDACDGLVGRLERISGEIASHPALSDVSKPALFLAWGPAVEKAIADDLALLEDDISRIGREWESLSGFMRRYIETVSGLPDSRKRREALETVEVSLLKMKASDL